MFTPVFSPSSTSPVGMFPSVDSLFTEDDVWRVSCMMGACMVSSPEYLDIRPFDVENSTEIIVRPMRAVGARPPVLHLVT